MADKKKIAGECYRKGNEAIEKGNWDYAINMYQKCVALVPDNLMYRQVLRGSERRKYGDDPSSVGRLAKAKLLGLGSKIKKAKSKENWDEADRLVEQGLAVNPWDSGLNEDLGDIAEQRDFGEIAQFAFENAVQGAPNNKDLRRKLAEVYHERGEYDKASVQWQKIYQLDPTDGHARSMAERMIFEKTTKRGGFEEAESTKDVMADHEISKRLGKSAAGEADAPGMSAEKDLQHAIRKAPEEVENYLKLADYYRKNKQLDKARDILHKALEVSGGNPKVREQVEDIELALMRKNRDLAREHAAEEGTDDARQGLKATETELLKRELEVLSKRVETYPKDMDLKLQLATRLMRIKKWDQAIPLLQKASQHPNLKGKAHFMLGKCFLHDNKLPLARGQLQRALPDLNYDTDPESFKEAHYLMGRVCEQLGDTETAENHYGEVLVVDYEYRDTRERLEGLQGGGAA